MSNDPWKILFNLALVREKHFSEIFFLSERNSEIQNSSLSPRKNLVRDLRRRWNGRNILREIWRKIHNEYEWITFSHTSGSFCTRFLNYFARWCSIIENWIRVLHLYVFDLKFHTMQAMIPAFDHTLQVQFQVLIKNSISNWLKLSTK